MKYWVAVASYNHVQRGLKEGICQVCHGKVGPLKSMQEGDFLIYYSPSEEFGQNVPCRRFTAIGRIKATPPYQYKMSPDFIPWRRDVAYIKAKEVDIRPLIPSLQFIQDKAKWGFPFRRGCFTILESDFLIIANSMGVLF